MGSKFALDPVMASYFRYSTHAQVLRDHPSFFWEAVVDPSEEARRAARDDWGVPVVVESVHELKKRCRPDVVVLAIPPGRRTDVVAGLDGLKAVFVEKPLGADIEEARKFVEHCRKEDILTQVNYWRRGDSLFQDLATGRLLDLIGKPLAGFGLYGNGLENNGSHMIDFVRMLMGEISRHGVVDQESVFHESPLENDLNVAFYLCLECGVKVLFEPIPFDHYREIGLDLWGEKGRLSILQESLGIYYYPRAENRAIQNDWEIASDMPRTFEPSCGTALFRMYDNLADAVLNGAALWSPAAEALETQSVVEDLIRACRTPGQGVPPSVKASPIQRSWQSR